MHTLSMRMTHQTAVLQVFTQAQWSVHNTQCYHTGVCKFLQFVSPHTMCIMLSFHSFVVDSHWIPPAALVVVSAVMYKSHQYNLKFTAKLQLFHIMKHRNCDLTLPVTQRGGNIFIGAIGVGQRLNDHNSDLASACLSNSQIDLIIVVGDCPETC